MKLLCPSLFLSIIYELFIEGKNLESQINNNQVVIAQEGKKRKGE